MASNSSNTTNVPEAKEAMNRLKMEVANEIGVPLSNGYNGNLTSAQNGSVGGYMVNIIYPEQLNDNPCKSGIILPENQSVFYRNLRSYEKHSMPIKYTYTLVI